MGVEEGRGGCVGGVRVGGRIAPIHVQPAVSRRAASAYTTCHRRADARHAASTTRRSAMCAPRRLRNFFTVPARCDAAHDTLHRTSPHRARARRVVRNAPRRRCGGRPAGPRHRPPRRGGTAPTIRARGLGRRPLAAPAWCCSPGQGSQTRGSPRLLAGCATRSIHDIALLRFCLRGGPTRRVPPSPTSSQGRAPQRARRAAPVTQRKWKRRGRPSSAKACHGGLSLLPCDCR